MERICGDGISDIHKVDRSCDNITNAYWMSVFMFCHRCSYWRLLGGGNIHWCLSTPSLHRLSSCPCLWCVWQSRLYHCLVVYVLSYITYLYSWIYYLFDWSVLVRLGGACFFCVCVLLDVFAGLLRLVRDSGMGGWSWAFSSLGI